MESEVERTATWWIEYDLCVCFVQSFEDYRSSNHARLLSLWRAVSGFRRQFVDAKSATELDLVQLRSEISRASRHVQSSCVNVNNSLHNAESQRQVCLTM